MSHDFFVRVDALVSNLPSRIAGVLKAQAWATASSNGADEALMELEAVVSKGDIILSLVIEDMSLEDQIDELDTIWALSDGSIAELEKEYQLVDTRR